MNSKGNEKIHKQILAFVKAEMAERDWKQCDLVKALDLPKSKVSTFMSSTRFFGVNIIPKLEQVFGVEINLSIQKKSCILLNP